MIVRELIAKLGFNVDTAKVDAWEKKVKKARATMKEASGAAKDLAKFAAKVSTVMAAAGGAIVGMVTRTAARFETLNASLKTVTGSTEAAAAAFDMIKKLAANTPFSVEQLTQSFIKLKALGLDSSKESLISYGNTAAAMGKDLNDMIEAVADAATGEFERLKEFGIKASSQGDQVSFTFQGVTTTVGKNAEEITNYLRGIGDNNFAGAMSDQMDTFAGIMSNIKDNIDSFLVQVGKEGLLDAMKEVGKEIRDMTGGGNNLAKTLGRTLAMSVRAVWRLLKEGIPLVLSLVEGFSGLLDAFGGPAGLVVALTSAKAAMTAFSLGMQAMQTSSAALSGALRGVGLAAGAMSIALAGAALIVAKTEKEIAKLKAHDEDVRRDAADSRRRFAKSITDADSVGEDGLVKGITTQINDDRAEIERLKLAIDEKGFVDGLDQDQRVERLAQLEDRLSLLLEEDQRRSEEGAQRESALGRRNLSDVASGRAHAVAPKTVQGEFLRHAREKQKDVGATDTAVEAAQKEFQKLLDRGATRAVAESRALKKIHGLSVVGGRKKKAKKKKDELTADELLERDFGGGLGSPIKGVRPTLGTTINKIDNSYAPKVDVKIEVAQQPGEDAGMLVGRIAEKVRDVLGVEIRRAVDHFQGATTG